MFGGKVSESQQGGQQPSFSVRACLLEHFLSQLLPYMNGNCKGVDVVSILHSSPGDHHRWLMHYSA